MDSVMKLNKLISILGLVLICSMVLLITHTVEAKSKTYSIKTYIRGADSLMPTVKIKLYNGDDHVIATKSIDLGKSAQHFDHSDFAGPTFKVTDRKDQHPNEVKLCMTKIKGGDCGAIRNIGKDKYDIEFFVRGLN